MFIITSLYWDRLFTKHNFIWLLQLLCPMLDNSLRLKLLVLHYQIPTIHYSDIFCLFFVRIFIPLKLPCILFLFYLCCSVLRPILDLQLFYNLCVGYSHFDNIFGTLYVAFLFFRVSDIPVVFSLKSVVWF